MRQPYTLTASEVEILRRAADDPDIFTDYWFRPSGKEKGWLFDDNFVEEGRWQKIVHHAAQTDIIVIGGFGTGKTIGIGKSACVWGATTSDFKFLNVAPTNWQARQMYDGILTDAAGTPFEKLIWERPRKPYPKIELRFYAGKTLVISTLEFMSADKDAVGILSWEGDWINIEEAGLLDNLEEVVTSVGSRLRGTIKGRTRLGRLSMISNSWENPYLWMLFDLAASDPDDYLSLVVSTRHNKNVTPEQFKKMLARIPVEERQRFIEGTRPEGKGSYFSKQAVYACESLLLSEKLVEEIERGTPGYSLAKAHGAGVTAFTWPHNPDALYMIFGDPGTDKAPNRNAPALMVWEIPVDFPKKPAILAALWWGDGGGAISPFIHQLFSFCRTYNPIFVGIDSTGPQKNVNELINIQYADEILRISPTLTISGMDFSGSKKAALLMSGRLLIEAGLLLWPKLVSGIRSQLTNYDPARDKKIPQDLVACIGMSGYGIRTWFQIEPAEFLVEIPGEAIEDLPEARHKRHSQVARNTRGADRLVSESQPAGRSL